MNTRPNGARSAAPLRGQLVILVHRSVRTRQRLTLELVRLGYAVLPLESEVDLLDYLDGTEAYDARVAFPDLLLVDELTLGFAGLRRLASLRQTSAPLPIVLLSDFAMSSVTDEELCSALHIVAVLRLPCTIQQLASTLAQAVPSPFTDENPWRS